MTSLVLSAMAFQVIGGVSIRDAIVSTCVIGMQSFSGLIVLRLFLSNAELDFLSELAIGFALGSALSTIADQLFITTAISGIAWLLPLILGLFVHVLRKPVRTSPRSQLADFSIVPFLLLAIPLLYGDLRQSGVLVVFLLGISAILWRKSQQPIQKASLILLALIPIGIVTFGLLNRSNTEYGPRLLKPLFTGSDDLVFSESMSFSLSHFGIHDYAASIGTTVRYHWFSMAWTGLVDRISRPAPFVITLHSAPIFVTLAIASMCFGISKVLVKSNFVGYILVAMLFGTLSSLEPQRFFTLLNTSNYISFLWIFLFVFLLLIYLKNSLLLAFIVLPSVAVVVLLSKAPYGVPLVGGLAGLVSHQIIVKSSRRREHFILFIVTLSSMILAYVIFLSPEDWEKRILRIRFNVLGFSSFGLAEKMITFAVLIFLMSALIVPGLLALGPKRNTISTEFLSFLVAGSLAGIVRFLLTGASGELYFLGVSSVFASIISSWAVVIALRDHRFSRRLHIALSLVSSLGFILPILANYDIANSSVLINSSRLLVVPTITTCIISISCWLILNIHTSRTLAVFLILCTTSVSSSRFLVESTKPVEYLSTTEVASNEDVRSLNWLKKFSQSDSIVATNRFLCASAEPCSFDDSSFLISAVARRRVLVEGPRFVIGGRPYPQWMTDRIALSTRFANKPNDNDLRELKRFGVSWFVVSERFLSSGTFVESDWAQFGMIRYHQNGIAIIELRD